MPEYVLAVRVTDAAGQVTAEATAPFAVRETPGEELREAWHEAREAMDDAARAAEDIGRVIEREIGDWL